jgi:hypothetical protein
MKPFMYQNWKKKESEQKIVNVLSQENKTHTQLLALTELSKPILSERLRSLKEQDKIASVADTSTKRFLYHLNYNRLDDSEKFYLNLYSFSVIAIEHLKEIALDSSISDKQYFDEFGRIIELLLTFRLLRMSVAPLQDQGEWLKTILGPEFAQDLHLILPNSRDFSTYAKNQSLSIEAVYGSKDLKRVLEHLLQHTAKTQKIMKK